MRSVSRGGRLRSGLDDDAAAIPHLHVQVVAVKQTHGDERSGVGRMGFDAPGLAVPERDGLVDIEAHGAAIGQDRLIAGDTGQSELRN